MQKPRNPSPIRHTLQKSLEKVASWYKKSLEKVAGWRKKGSPPERYRSDGEP